MPSDEDEAPGPVADGEPAAKPPLQVATSALVDHVEKTFADAYRKEIDQEENIWRTLPFFAATLALEVTALTQLRAEILAMTGWRASVAGSLGVAILVTALTALYYLTRSIAFAEFKYIAAEPQILGYVSAVEAAEKQGMLHGGESALITVKRFLSRQYAATADNNRAINQHRAKMRTTAGFATLASVLATLALGAFTVVAQIWPVTAQPGGTNAERPQAVAPPGDLGAQPPQPSPERIPSDNRAADPGRGEGVVHPPRVDGNGGESGAREQ